MNVKVTSIMIMIVLLGTMFVPMFFPFRTASASFYGYGGTNTTPLDGSETVTLLNVTFENDTLGTHEITMWHSAIYWAEANLSGPNYLYNITSMTGHDHVLSLNQTGRANATSTSGFLIGHALASNFTFSYDFYPQGVTLGGTGGIEIGLVADKSYGSPLASAKYKQAGFYFGVNATANSVTNNHWYNVTFDVNMYAQTVTYKLNDVIKDIVDVSITEIAGVRIAVDKGSYDGTIKKASFDNLNITQPKHAIQPLGYLQDTRTAFMITFDGGYDSVYDNYSVMHGYPSQIDLVTNATDIPSPSNANWTELMELVNTYGCELGSHGTEMVDHLTLSAASQAYQFGVSKAVIQSHTGVAPITFSWPFDSYNIAGAELGWQFYEFLGTREAGSLPTLYDLDRYYLFNTADTGVVMSKLWHFLYPCVYGHYGFMHGYTHHIGTPIPSYSTSPAALDFLMSRLASNGSRVITPSMGLAEIRNARSVNVTGNADSFTTSYHGSYGNFTNDECWFLLPESQIYGVGTYSISSDGTYGVLTSGQHDYGLYTQTTSSQLNLTVTEWSAETKQWTPVIDSASDTVTYTLVGLEDGMSYRVFQDGAYLTYGAGPSFTFVASGNASIAVTEWHASTVSRLVMLTVNMLAMGLLVGVIGAAITPLRNPKNRNPDKMMKIVLNVTVCIIVGIILITLVNDMFIGG